MHGMIFDLCVCVCVCLQDEVLAVCKRIVVPVEDLVRWACPEPLDWQNPPGSSSSSSVSDVPREDKIGSGDDDGTTAEQTSPPLGNWKSNGETT